MVMLEHKQTAIKGHETPEMVYIGGMKGKERALKGYKGGKKRSLRWQLLESEPQRRIENCYGTHRKEQSDTHQEQDI